MNGIQGHRVLVVGLGHRSGLAACNFLARRGFGVTGNDMKSAAELAPVVAKMDSRVKVVAGAQDPSLLDAGFDLLVLSPGVPQTIPLIREAYRRGVPVISEIELAFRFMKGQAVGITGTDGKSTTTTLTGHILSGLGLPALVGGNIGVPLVSLMEHTDDTSVSVIELSSFQLETVRDFRADAAAVLNITPDHLDRYPGMKEYAAAKMRIAEN
ncbi:MAG: UDP-N-acetylmuramoyl-L-alanine--D-glutamate ligase, partial [Spirochaetes bacterium]|nr:UDP-N-acetylmuramoyl-L-alanine--D-glutamate ligase [Spirochaetota bacterium]